MAFVVRVPYENRKWFIYRESNNTMNLYLDKDSTKKAEINWASWLGTDGIASVTWQVENNSGLVTIANDSVAGTTATVYVTGTTYDSEINIKATMTTDAAIPEIDSRSIWVRTNRTY